MPSATTTTRRVAEAARDPKIEKLLKDNGFTGVQLSLGVNLAAFDEEASLKNQARMGHPIDEKTVTRYVTAMENGDEFPPLIAWEPRDGAKLIIVDGNHRFQARKRVGLDTAPVYIIVGARSQAVTILSFIVNKDHGLATTEEDRLHQALYMIDNGVSVADAARRLTLNPTKLGNAAKLARADTRAALVQGMNIRRWERLSVSARTRLNAIALDEVFAAMAKLTLDAGLPMEDVNRAVTELGGRRNFKDQMRYVEDLRASLAEQIQTGGSLDAPGVGRQFRSPRTLFLAGLGQVRANPPAAIIERMTPEDLTGLRPKVEEGIENLNAMLKAISEAMDQ